MPHRARRRAAAGPAQLATSRTTGSAASWAARCSQRTRLTVKTHPPQSRAAPVAPHTALTVHAPMSAASRMSLQRTTSQWQTIMSGLLGDSGRMHILTLRQA
ncbi:hypothetical protein BN12_470007 [Nostocoides japonicum T1-X7]|uniref:Uncharacterized protein n=1 Tax=Nostocoides japonicum T1-X7 TaxID=1194083 RepID=A0A077M393_9MICO|nr:hypothetical protein BN12_470007 [Tetrasphaera japonica T1-X7]